MDATGTALCWGSNSDGQLGIEPIGGINTTAIEISAPTAFVWLDVGTWFACGVDSDGAIWCWGDNRFGQHGDGNTGTHNTNPVQANPPAGVTFTQVTAGELHTCALDTDGTAWCWGDDDFEQLGTEAVQDASTPIQVEAPADVIFTSIEAGYFYNCAIDNQGAVWCWGSNAFGQLGNGATDETRPTPIEVEMPNGVEFVQLSLGWSHTCAIDTEGAVWCWGMNEHGQLGVEPTDPIPVPTKIETDLTFTQIELGASHSCGLDSSGTARCWGWNALGPLGDGTTESRSTPTEVVTPAGVTFSYISGGENHSCAVDTSEAAWCWGNNDSGWLGDGTTEPSLTPTQVIGFPPDS